MENLIFWTVYVFVVGLCIGSFLNVVVLRGLSGESIVLPPSHCTKCNHKLAWYDNIPLFSYIFLLGKCRYCKEKISIQYPLVELFTGLIFAGIFYKFANAGFSINPIFLMAAASLMIVLAVIDIKEKVILDIHAYILAALGLIYNFFNLAGVNRTRIHFFVSGFDIAIYQTFIYSLLGLIAGFAAMSGIAWICKLITKKDCFGEGDSYILGALGAFFGIVNVIVIFILSIMLWGLLSVPAFLYKLFKEKDFKLLTSLLLFGTAVIIFGIGEILKVFDEGWLYWLCYAIIAGMGIYSCKLMIASIKTKEPSQLGIIPFGPALIFAAFLVMFILK